MSNTSDMHEDQCLLCGLEGLEALSPPLVAGVTSDCQPWPVVAQPCHCPACGHVQKRRDAYWKTQSDAIYAAYAIDQDQCLVEEDGIVSRKQRVLAKFLENMELSSSGRMLDLGCGNGNFFPMFHAARPNWDMYGSEYNSAFRDEVLARKGVLGFHDGPLAEAPAGFSGFDLVTQFFVVEHLPDPVGVLRDVRKLLKDDGLVLVHTDDLVATPFDLAVTDHVSHFVLDTLVRAMRLAGFEQVMATNHWVAKQISVVARVGEEGAGSPDHAPQAEEMRQLSVGHLQWLERIRYQVECLADFRGLGILGTAIAGTWLANSLNGEVDFFVDEAPNKVGTWHMGLPVYALENVPAHSRVFLAFPPTMALRIQQRLALLRPDVTFVLPLDFTSPGTEHVRPEGEG